jgi:hypothetical protein
MNDGNPNVYVYLLIDNGLLHEVSASYTEPDLESRPAWLAPIYAERALAVSPFLVDVEAAYEVGDLDRVMNYVNARTPALHVSIIETGLDLGELARHLRRFIFILGPQGKQFTLRYADCAVLAPLSSVLTPAQWATMRGPIARWNIHNRSGSINPLPPAEVAGIESTPFRLDKDQLAALDEASEPDHCIAKVKMMRNGAALPGDAVEQHEWARAARQAWRAANNSNTLILMFLTEAALLTRGEVLRSQEVPKFLAMNEVSAFRSKLGELVDEIQERRNRVGPEPAEGEKSNVSAIFI